MNNEIIINAEPGETRVAVLERSQFTELHIERDKDRSVVGSVVKGRVTRVLPDPKRASVSWVWSRDALISRSCASLWICSPWLIPAMTTYTRTFCRISAAAGVYTGTQGIADVARRKRTR